MRWVSLVVRAAIGLGAFLAAKAVLILAVTAVSLSIAIASFAVPALASAMWRVASVFGPPAVATVTETAQLRRQNQGIERRNQTLERMNQDLRQTNVQQARVSDALSTENRVLTGDNNRLRGRMDAHSRVTASAARRIGQRAVRTATRSVVAIPLESVPLLGVATIIATTAWEIRDTCDTLDDMAEIQRHLGQEPDSSFAAKACSNVPLWEARVDHYGTMSISECRASAQAARDRVFELADQVRDQVADQVRDQVADLVASGNDFDADVVQAADDEFDEINAICDCIADLLCDRDELARR